MMGAGPRGTSGMVSAEARNAKKYMHFTYWQHNCQKDILRDA